MRANGRTSQFFAGTVSMAVLVSTSLSLLSSPIFCQAAQAEMSTLDAQNTPAVAGSAKEIATKSANVEERPEPKESTAASANTAEKLSTIEKQFYDKDYSQESVSKRLARLEIFVFGQLKPEANGDEKRLSDLQSAMSDKSTTYHAGEKLLVAELSLPPAKAKAKKETYQSMFNKASADMRARRYHAAADELLQSIKLNPRFTMGYAYLGDVLYKLKDTEGAKEAYRACFEVDPFGKYGRYGKAKLMGLAAQAAYNASSPQDSPKVVERTINTINTQAADLAGRYRTEYANSTSWRQALLTLAQRRAQEAARIARASGRQSSWYGNDRNEMSDRNAINSYWAQTEYNMKIYRARAEAARKAAFVAQSAADLKAQMLQPVGAGGSTLRALGTNLYVRYYGDENSSINDPPAPEDPVEELAAVAHKMPAATSVNRASYNNRAAFKDQGAASVHSAGKYKNNIASKQTK